MDKQSSSGQEENDGRSPLENENLDQDRNFMQTFGPQDHSLSDYHQRSQNNQQKQSATWDDLATECLSQTSASDLSQIQVHEAKVWSMRWIVLGVTVGWIMLGTGASLLLFLLTRSSLVFLLLTTTIGVAPAIVRDISRFLFWRPDDYKLEEQKQIHKMKKWERKQTFRMKK